MKGIILNILAIFILSSFASGQVVLYDTIVFDEEKSKLTESAVKTLLKIPETVKTLDYFEISLTGYLEKPNAGQVQQSLAMKRIREICKQLVEQNLGNHVGSVEIVSVGMPGKKMDSKGEYQNRVDIMIREQFPAPLKEDCDEDEIRLFPLEPDTIITLAGGTQVVIKGGTFYPGKTSDYTFDIKELITTDDFLGNNVSTTTADRQVIKTPRAIRILALPNDPGSAAPVKMQKPAVILIPCLDSSASVPLTLFYQAKDSKSYITWKKSYDTTTLKQYGGKKFYRIHVNQLGWVMVGKYVTSCNCSLAIPRFQEQKMSIVYPDLGSVVYFENIRDPQIGLPCPEGPRGMITSASAIDKSGQIFLLNSVFSTPETAKNNIGIYRIRKRDYVKL